MPNAPEVKAYALRVRQPLQVTQRSTPSSRWKTKRIRRTTTRVTSRGAQYFQDLKNVVNVIFGGDGNFPSKHAQKLTLREILSIEPTIQNPLRYSKVPISFSIDDQWTSFSELGKFSLVLDPVVVGS
jgi:hypothetical protein